MLIHIKVMQHTISSFASVSIGLLTSPDICSHTPTHTHAHTHTFTHTMPCTHTGISVCLLFPAGKSGLTRRAERGEQGVAMDVLSPHRVIVSMMSKRPYYV